MSANADDLYVALALVDSGLIANPEVAIELSANLETKDFAHGVSVGSRDLRQELLRAGRERFESLMRGVRSALCEADRVRFLTRASSELVIFVTELLVATHAISFAVAMLCARIVVAEGLESFCRSSST